VVKLGKIKGEGNPSLHGSFSLEKWFFDFASFFQEVHPERRIQTLLAEIQKRTLAEQVLLLSSETKDSPWVLLKYTPSHEACRIPESFWNTIASQAGDVRKARVLEDFAREWKSEGMDCVVCRITETASGGGDVLVVLNYATLGDLSRVFETVSFYIPLLALSLHYHRLFQLLEKKEQEIRGWKDHIERRIEEGTKKLLERELQFYALFEGAQDGIVVHDVKGKFLEVNRVAGRLFGCEKKELLERDWFSLVPPEAHEKLSTFFSSVCKREAPQPMEIFLKKKEGSTFIAELSSRPVKFMGQDAIQTLIRDITIRKQLEEGLREEREKYRMLVESSLIGVFIMQQGIVRFANEKFAKLLGYSVDELMGKSLFDFVDPEDRTVMIAREMDREKGLPIQNHYEVKFLTKEGAKLWCEIYCSLLMLEGVPSILGNVLDISARKQWETQVLEAQKMESIGRLAGGIAHEFNNLLGGILGYASLLLSDLKEDHPFYQDIQTIAETAKKAADLTNRLLAFARGGKYQVTTLDVHKIAEDVLAILSSSIDPNIRLETHFTQNPWPVRGDARQIHQAFMNVCLNAIEAMPGGGKLVFKTENVLFKESEKLPLGLSVGEYVCITISDTGVGMDERVKSRVFEPFFTTKPGQEKKGLGLSVVYGIVKNHGGAVEIQSELGKGTEVKLYFPRFVAPETEASSIEWMPSTSGKVLIVDDEELIRHVGERMVRKKGFDVLLAKNGKEAIEIYKKAQKEISVVLLDLIMPEMDGKTTYRELKRINPNVKVVFTSGYGPQDRPDLIEDPRVVFLQKPFYTESLYNAIVHAMKNGSGFPPEK